MPEPQLLILGSALDLNEATEMLGMLAEIDVPNSKKCIATPWKFDARKLAQTMNVDAGYPAELVHLQSLSACAELPLKADQRFHDGYDLFCLRKVLTAAGPPDYAALLRDTAGFQEHLSEFRDAHHNHLFLTWSSAHSHGLNLIIKGGAHLTDFLELAWELYESAAAYAMSPYSLDHALAAAAAAQTLCQPFPKPPAC